MIADAMPPLLASILPPDQLELMRQRLLQLPEPEHPRLTKRDGLGAIAICLLSFLSTFPIVIPFILISDARLALRLSNAVAIAMLFVCGYAFGRCAGFRPWATGLSMVAVGAAQERLPQRRQLLHVGEVGVTQGHKGPTHPSTSVTKETASSSWRSTRCARTSCARF